ncbi:MAG: hypothetical protein ACT4PV_15915 [Planctomycetaceae bacterium]
MKQWKYLSGLLLFAACGGGGGPALQTAALRGVVYELDGQTLDRSGVLVTIPGTGASQVTTSDGRFAFSGLPVEVVSVQFGSSLVAAAHSGGPGESSEDGEFEDESEDGFEDESEDGSEDETEDELEDEWEHEDGEWHISGVDDSDDIEIRVAIRDGEVVEFSMHGRDRLRAEARLIRVAGASDGDVEGKVKIEVRSDRQKFWIEAEHLAAGTDVEFFLDDPATAEGFVSIGTAVADLSGEAEFERNTADGESLPLGAGAVADLSGFAIEVRLVSSGALILMGEVPSLPESGVEGGVPPLEGQRARGGARLTPALPGLEGKIEIRTRPEQNRERFKMEAEHLVPGDRVTFQIEDPAGSGSYASIATRTADEEGEAELETEGLLPLGATKVSDLVGRPVRVIRADGSSQLLLSGAVPPLVTD